MMAYPDLEVRLTAAGVRGALRFAEPLAKHCTWRVGGPAEVCFEPRDKEDVCNLLRALPTHTEITWLGLGSNVLVRDGGLDGVVILTSPGLCAIRCDNDRVFAEAGVPCPKIAKQSAGLGLTGGEFLTGIPGSLGGALAMNAGAYGGETWTTVTRVETVDRTGKLRWRARAEYQVGYRSVSGPQCDEWFVGAELQFARDDAARARARIRELLGRRNASQPTGLSSCGSVFRNPPGDFAGRLVEAAGLKGFRMGGCRVSDIHANFIVNDQSATAAEIETLIAHVRATVAARFNVRLEPEVRVLGRAIGERSTGTADD